MNQIVKDMISQVGGNRTCSMTGCSIAYSNEENYIVLRNFKNGGASKVKHVRIAYDAGQDLYTMKFLTRTGKILNEMSGVYADMLMDIIEEQTKMYLTLFTRA